MAQGTVSIQLMTPVRSALVRYGTHIPDTNCGTFMLKFNVENS